MQKIMMAFVMAFCFTLCIVGCTNTSQGEIGANSAQQGEARGLIPMADEIFIHSYGGTTTIDNTAKYVDVLNESVLADSEEYAAMDVTEQDITRILSTEVCIELVYDTPVQSDDRWNGVQRLLIQLSDDGYGSAGLMFAAKGDGYQSGPWLAFDEAGITALVSYFEITPPPNGDPPANEFRSIEEWFDVGDAAQLIIEYQSRLQPATLSNPDNYDVIFYQSVPFDGGDMVLAEFRGDGETHPELYYIKDDIVEYSTVYSYTWGINYTVFKDYMILFGMPELVLSNNSALDEADLTDYYEISAEFSDETVSAYGDHQGFVLIKKGLMRPLSFEVANSKGTVVLNIKNIYNASSDFGKNGLARNTAALNYCPLTTPEALHAQITIDFEGDEIPMYFGQLHLTPDLPPSYLWMDAYGNTGETYLAGQKFDILSEEQIYEYFWLDIGHCTLESSFDDLIMMTGREMPDESGDYMLVFNTDKGYYTLVVRITE